MMKINQKVSFLFIYLTINKSSNKGVNHSTPNPRLNYFLNWIIFFKY